jgi:hypothetical protein
MYPGSIPSVKMNLFNVILVLDLSHTSSLNFISGPVSNIINRNLPLRFGVVPQVETEDGTSLFHNVVSLNAELMNIFRQEDGQALLLSHRKLRTKRD